MGEWLDKVISNVEYRIDYVKRVVLSNQRLICFVIIIILFAALVFASDTRKSKFMNKSTAGFYYDTTDMSFSSPADRAIAIKYAISTLSKSFGMNYTTDQFEQISPSFIISLVEAEDDTELNMLANKLSVLVDPMYKPAFIAVAKALSQGNKFDNGESRRVVYELLVRYFNLLKTSVPPLQEWADVLLIQAFKTMRAPSKAEFARYPNTAVSSTFIPPGVMASIPVTPIAVSSI
jgi:hypothetical protein